ncbi:MAG: HAMP domain-containing sensor histidine kinase [Pseudomonadota bacterium]|nr:HAMP domain-containing sensor histidine kinase [Pseudomonadota bacterium]
MLKVKRLLPRSLFGRSIMIIVMPLILLQVVSTWVFYDRHWETITRRLASAVAGEIASVIDNYLNFPGTENESWIFYSARSKLDLQFNFRNKEVLSNYPDLSTNSLLEHLLGNALRERAQRPFRIDAVSEERRIRILIQLKNGVMDVIVDRERLFSSTTYIFVMWMVGTSFILFVVATIFMRNQVRPIRRLATAVDNFGKGREDLDFKPEGSTEIRQAAIAFNVMRERIQRTISQRTEMLAGISHDLRTPLTRMKLQLAMLKEGPKRNELSSDVFEMEKMVEEYLSFARGESSEQVKICNLREILEEVVKKCQLDEEPIALNINGNLQIPLKINALKRAITNIVNNAIQYGSSVNIHANKKNGNIEILVDDSGPGIPKNQREDVFKPFYRLDNSRSPDRGGTGLGLTIARDSVRAHGGDLVLESSPSGGTRAKLRLPT